jgi:hypothetical protein
MRGAADVVEVASRLVDAGAAGRVEREREAWRSKHGTAAAGAPQGRQRKRARR